jgi:hypothetical protein
MNTIRGLATVVWRSADEFTPFVRPFNEAGVAEGGQCFIFFPDALAIFCCARC